MTEIARLTPIPLRKLWCHEAMDFTRWLAENLDYLEEPTGLKLELEKTEASVGDFSVDILATGPGGANVIIENQLGKTDHDHLGKLLTYMVNLEAKIAIWVTSWPRPEHEKVVHWMNEILPADSGIYLVQVEAFCIGDSPPAAKFTLVAGPSEESRHIGDERKQLAERHRLHMDFWQMLLEKAQTKTNLHASLSPSKDHWKGAGAGRTGLAYNYVILKDRGRVELYIDTGDRETNRLYFDSLQSHQSEIEEAFGKPLRWEAPNGRRAARIAHDITGLGGLRDREKWLALQEAMIDAMIRLEKAFAPFIRRLPQPPTGA